MRFGVAIGAVLILLISGSGIGYFFGSYYQTQDELQAIRAGVITEKRVDTSQDGRGLGAAPQEYHIVVDESVEVPFVVRLLTVYDKVVNKEFIVDADTYTKYNVGDYFDLDASNVSGENTPYETTVIDGKTYNLVPVK